MITNDMSRKSRSLNRLRNLTIAVVLGLLLVLPAAVAAQTEIEERFETTVPVDAPFELHQLVLDFVPGTVAPLHRHGGPGYITMLEGELTLLTDGDENVYRAGESFVEVPESLYEGWNATDNLASLIVTYIVPEGHDVTTYVDSDSTRSGPAPQPVTQATFTEDDPPAGYQVVHYVMELVPEEWVSFHDERGRTYITVIEGALTIEDADGARTTLQPSDTLTEGEGPGHRLGNTGDEPVWLAATLLVPEEAESFWRRSRQVGVIIAAGALGLAGGAILLRRRERSAA